MKDGRAHAKKKEEILNEARKIMKDFLEALNEMPEAEDCFPRTKMPLRDKEDRKENYDGFKELLFMNAPRHNTEYILAEKKKWD